MNSNPVAPPPSAAPQRNSFKAPVAVGLASWLAITLGFVGINLLMQERPEFVGEPSATSKVVLIQDSPRVAIRSYEDDVSAVKFSEPEFSEIQFDMHGRRDYRGLKTISDMSGQVVARYLLTNRTALPQFVLFKCPQPRAEDDHSQGVQVNGLKLTASIPGTQENGKNAWLWSGSLPPQGFAAIEISYQVGSLKGLKYQVPAQTGLSQVRVIFNRQDLDSMRFESGDGPVPSATDKVQWERKAFLGPDSFSATLVDARSLYTALSQLMEIGPLVSLLFLLAVLATLVGRREVTALQVLTIAAGYALYFPLILYLSSRFSFGVALAIAFLVPGALLVNYSRFLVGPLAGLFGAPILLALYQVFPTLAAFAGWKRGMVLLALGILTLWVLINLQNRALKRQLVTAGVLWFLAMPNLGAAELQVLLPAELRKDKQETEKPDPLIASQTAEYDVNQTAGYFLVSLRLPFESLRTGSVPVPLFALPIHLETARLDTSPTNLAQLVTVSNCLSLFLIRTGSGTLSLSYRVPIQNQDGKKRAMIPVSGIASATVRLRAQRDDIQFLTGTLWSRQASTESVIYEAGVAGEPALTFEWPDEARPETPKAVTQKLGLYGIGLTRAQNLTVINSDGSCVHFAEFELPAIQQDDFLIRLPAGTRLVSALVNGTELSAPHVEDDLCRIHLPERSTTQTSHKLSFRLAYPKVHLGFIGSAELALPQLFQTAGTLEWAIALPEGFQTKVISSGLENQPAPLDLSAFGDYGRVLKLRPQLSLLKTLAPPGKVGLNLQYHQVVPSMQESHPD